MTGPIDRVMRRMSELGLERRRVERWVGRAWGAGGITALGAAQGVGVGVRLERFAAQVAEEALDEARLGALVGMLVENAVADVGPILEQAGVDDLAELRNKDYEAARRLAEGLVLRQRERRQRHVRRPGPPRMGGQEKRRRVEAYLAQHAARYDRTNNA